MEPLTTLLIGALSAAAAALAGGVADAAGGDAWAAVTAKLGGWIRLEQRKQQAALDQAISAATSAFRREYRGPLPTERLLVLLANETPEAQAFRQALAEELIFSAKPDLGRLADLYRRQVAFLSLLRREQPPAWADAEPALRELLGLIEQQIAKQAALRPLLLERAELQALDVARANAHSTADSAATLRRIEALLSDVVTLPRISASISAAEGASINNAPLTIVIGDQHSYTIAPVQPQALDALYRRYCEFIGKGFGTLDFRGIVQRQNVVRLRLEDVYVPLNGVLGARDRRALGGIYLVPTSSVVAILEYDPSKQPTPKEDKRAGKLLSANAYALPERVYPWGSQGELLVNLVRNYPFLVILGDPGAGKSTLVRMIMLALAEGRGGSTFGFSDEWLPIFFPVAAFAEVRGDPGSRDISLLTYLRDYYRGREQPDYTPLFERALLAGRALVLFDGIDEVRDDRLAIVRCLGDFIRAWDAPGNRFLATSRIAGYEDAPLDDALFQRVTMQPFSDDDIRLFAQRWSMAFERAGLPNADLADPELIRRAESRNRDLSAAIFGQSNVTELARNPLLLTILALIHNQGMRLPDRRVDLYRLCVEALAETWNRARNLAGREISVYLGDEKLDERFVVNLLGPAALWIHTESPGGIVDERDLERKLTETLVETDGLPRGKASRLAADFLRLVNRETGLLQERGHRRYSFLHLTFEEYLAARALVDSAAIEDADAEFHRRASDPGWREVIRLALASVAQKEAQRLLLHLLAAPTEAATHGRPLVLAGECLLDIGRNGATRRAWDAVTSALLDLLADPVVPIATRVEGGGVLGRLGDPRLLDVQRGEAAGLGHYDAVEPYWCAIESGPFWIGDECVEDTDENDGEDDSEAEDETDSGTDSEIIEEPGNDDQAEETAHPPRFDPAKLTRIELPYDFKIARYPVTNAEFARFVKANGPDGYDPSKPWWTEAGKKFLAPGGKRSFLEEELKGKAMLQPRYWNDSRYNGLSQPVVGISWYEAAAYCNWLTEQGQQRGWLPADSVIRLPTSLEWERAARHTDTRPFPWGAATPTAEHANYADTGVGGPSPVGCFHAGRAVCGADDLVGNVLEWLATPDGAGADPQPRKDFTSDSVVALSFTYYDDGLEQMCCGARYRSVPDSWNSFRSFRIVQSLVR